jgi:tetratricopeptide (TPR) repeat protein
VERKPQSEASRAVQRLASAFREALALHRSGQLGEAKRRYRRILATAPDHFDSLHLLGVILHQEGDHAAAVEQIDAALKINPDNAYACNNRAVVLQELMRFDAALASCDRAIALTGC